MRILVLVTGEYGWRHVEHLRATSPPTWQIEVWQAPKILPPVLDYPEEFLPETLPASDLILALFEVKAANELIPDVARMTGARAVIAPVDSRAWLPVGLARQLCEWLARQGVACVTPRPFCSLTETHINALREKTAYDDPLIREFARHYGQPAFEVEIDPGARRITQVRITRDVCCGCAHFVADKLIGTSVDDAVQDAGLYHHHYPCHASMGIDSQYGDTLMHVSGNLMKDALKDALAPHFQQRYIRPAGWVEDSAADD